MTPAERTAIRDFVVDVFAPYTGGAERISWARQSQPEQARVHVTIAALTSSELGTPERTRVDATTRAETQEVRVTAQIQIFSKLAEASADQSHWQNADALADLIRRHFRSETKGAPLLADKGIAIRGPVDIENLDDLTAGSIWESRAALTFTYDYRRRYEYAIGDVAGISGTGTFDAAVGTPGALTETFDAEP